MRAEGVIPGESDEDFAELLAAHSQEYNPQTPLQQLLVTRAAKAFQKLERGDRVEEALAAQLRNEAAIECEERTAGELAALIDQLPADPAGSMRRLRKSLPGCLWIREQLLIFKTRLETEPGLLASQRELSLFLVGKRLTDVFRDDPVATRWMLAHLGTLFGHMKEVDPAVILGNTGIPSFLMGTDELHARASALARSLPGLRQSLELLRGYVAEELARLEEHIEFITEVSQRDRELDIAAAEIPLTPEGKQLTGYVNTQRQAYDSLLRRLDALRKQDRPRPDGGRAAALSRAGRRANRQRPESSPRRPMRRQPKPGVATEDRLAVEIEAPSGACESRLDTTTEPPPTIELEAAVEPAIHPEREFYTSRPILREERTIQAEGGPVTSRPITLLGPRTEIPASRARSAKETGVPGEPIPDPETAREVQGVCAEPVVAKETA